jgi:Flp pilus assembly protein TadD
VGRQIRLRPLVFVASTLAAASLGLITTAAIRTRQATDKLAAGDPQAAASEARSALKLNDRDLGSYYVLAAAFARNDQYGDARATLIRAASLEPHNFVPEALLGDLAVRRRDLAAAALAYRRASALNPRNAELRSNARRTAQQARAAG